MPLLTLARAAAAAALTAVVLGACSQQPYPVTPAKAVQRALDRELARPASEREPGLGPGSRVVSICYSNLINSPQEVLAEAQYQCQDGRVTLREHDVVWTPCSLLQPVRATFVCTPDPAPKGASADE